MEGLGGTSVNRHLIILSHFSTRPLGRKPFPMAFGDNLDHAIDHLIAV